jgi:hypothetical protein
VMPNAIVPEAAASPTNPGTQQFSVDLSDVTERVRIVTPARTEGARLASRRLWS